MEAKDKKWCPQHGYPLPCDKCGMPLTQQKEIYKAGMREVVEWITCKAPAPNTILYVDRAKWEAFKKERGL